ncbi:MAG: TIGR00730 family Rossman fold protein [Ruminococcus sp.]|nr:TIGR00730 family Rossman fold protein [Ruminococcus sp.]
MTICVFGSSSDAIDRAYLDAAEQLGERIATRGDALIYGAGKYGVMGAVSRGVLRGGGKMTGVSPQFFVNRGVLADYSEIVFTETMRERKAYMEDNSDAFIICAGGIGTFEEFFEVLTLKQLGRHQKPIIIYNVRGYYTPLLELMEQSIREHFLAEDTVTLYAVAETEDEVFSLLDSYEAAAYDKYGGK